MADIFDKLDELADEMAIRTGVAYKEVIEGLDELVKGKSAEEAAVILSGISIETALTAKLKGVFDLFESGAIDLLSEMPMTSALSEQALRSTLNNVKDYLSTEFIDKVAPDIRGAILDGIVGELEPSQVLKNLIDDIDLSPAKIRTIVNSGYSQYSNAVKKMMFDKVPKTRMFVYVGAYDNKTRPNCVKKIEASPATKEYILDNFFNFDNEVWNCRHSWEEVTNDIVGQGFRNFKTEL